MRTSLQAAMAAINLYSEYFLSLIISMTIARSLSTEDYGLYSTIIWLAAIGTIAINAGVTINITKFIAEFNFKDATKLPAVMAYFRNVQLQRVAIVSIVLFGLVFFGLVADTIPLFLSAVLIICIIIKADYMFRVSAFKGLKRFDIIAKTSLIANPFNIIAVLICAYIAPSLINFVIVFCLTSLIYGLSTRIFNHHLPKPLANQVFIDEHKSRLATQLISSTIIVFLGALIFKQSQVFVLERNDLLSEAGFFNIAFILATAATTLVPGIYQEILLPKITEAVQAGKVESQVGQAERYLLILSLLIAIPVVNYADEIILLLFGERYLPAVLPLQILALAKVIHTMAQGANLTLISSDKQQSMAKTHIFLFAVAFALSLALVPQYGLYGALATYVSIISLLFIIYTQLAKKAGYKMIKASITAKIVFISLLSAIPMLAVDMIIDGFLGAIFGGLIFAATYLNVLFIAKGFDNAVCSLLNQLAKKLPNAIGNYVQWGVKRYSR
ncbi:polysaccharide biosynthesis C-terminal domain-containing protein [Thalassotalea sp. LPB0316]|uniref:oligosaccharide flippase family protein n=1 Tax=Thalassotalea sp. LPB0316 TaxID=2769490 RepID=UPI001869530A|nr:polysaccharide biosynthesis C-terminal domain-containing protein [Thalassotalea sp. LPB0316]QOL26496.1 polysaccharide biosynthesis C-terminal domain-containing protein [Thalassotalea sp. LPB0316]